MIILLLLILLISTINLILNIRDFIKYRIHYIHILIEFREIYENGYFEEYDNYVNNIIIINNLIDNIIISFNTKTLNILSKSI
jgi:hypothetical protein